MLGEWGFGRETELGEGGGASGLRVVPQSPSVPGAGGSRDGPDPPGSWHGDGGQVSACRGSDPPPPPAAGGTRDSSGLRGLGAPAELCQAPCARGVVPRGEKGGASGVFRGAGPQKVQGWPLGKRGLPQTPEPGRWVGGVDPRHIGVVPPRGVWRARQGTVTPNCRPAAPATPPPPRLLLTAAHSSGTAALFTPDRSAPGVTGGCCKPGPARHAAAAVTPSAEPGLATEPGPPGHAHPTPPGR